MIEFVREPIAIPGTELSSREIGASVEFRGIVREREGDRAIGGLFYEAYEPMARLQLARILDQLRAEFGFEGVHFVHRLGWVPVGETSLFVRVLAQHRGAAFAVAAKLIDRLKQDVPIWKSVIPSGVEG